MSTPIIGPTPEVRTALNAIPKLPNEVLVDRIETRREAAAYTFLGSAAVVMGVGLARAGSQFGLRDISSDQGLTISQEIAASGSGIAVIAGATALGALFHYRNKINELKNN